MGDRGSFFTEPYRDQSVCRRPGGILAAGEFREALPFLALLLPFCQRLTHLLVVPQHVSLDVSGANLYCGDGSTTLHYFVDRNQVLSSIFISIVFH